MEQSDTVASYTEAGRKNVTLVYILILLGFVIGLSPIIGVIFAYLNRGKGEGWVDSHYTFQIRTFWIALIASFISMLLMMIAIGFILLILVAIWTIIRCVKGLQLASRGDAVPDPGTWMF
ncbi:DUF4870 domain-containing protein [Roseibium sp. RKSG952]|uniref:DUF4870 family protein n=1 Tax=Roseibium sp. RKSG952 TaxID=2529384 RepID=UPI0012BB81D2|nr:DUF4870 domain-containing protein [Roseibium sp. RKSG952]MTI00652.1 hypothetical protein [Roseibium sp. RKSG952]